MSDRRLRYFEFWRRDPRRDVDDEIEFHLEARIADLVTRGLSPAEARRQAMAEFGDARRGARASRSDRSAHAASRPARRMVARCPARRARQPALAPAHADLRRHGRALCRVRHRRHGGDSVGDVRHPHPAPALRRRGPPRRGVRREHGARLSRRRTSRGRTTSPGATARSTFASIGIWTWTTATLSDDASEAERAYGALVSANLFPTLRRTSHSRAILHRDEETPGRDAVVLLSHRLWQRRFASDSAIVGKRIMVDGRAHTVVGVMPASFNFPDRGDIWLPFSVTPANEEHGNRGYAGAIGRLKPGYTIEQGTADLHAIDAALHAGVPSREPRLARRGEVDARRSRRRSRAATQGVSSPPSRSCSCSSARISPT